MTTTDTGARPEVDAAIVLLAKLGLTPQDLVNAAAANRPPVPTFAAFVPELRSAVTRGTLKAYGTYWNRAVEAWGERRLDEVTPLEIERLGEALRAARVVRSNDRGGHSLIENLIGALRFLYRRAIDNGFLTEGQNSAAKVKKPRRVPSNRIALQDDLLEEIVQVAESGGTDPVLDVLMLRLHLETAARRGGALAIRPMDLDMKQCLIRLREKGGTERWQPASPSLMAALHDLAVERGAAPSEQLLRYRKGRPITYRRYDGLWERIREALPWAAAQGISNHWLRHTVLTWVERNFGYGVAHAYAGHTDFASSQRERNRRDSTTVYIKADLWEVANALVALTGEPHPLAR